MLGKWLAESCNLIYFTLQIWEYFYRMVINRISSTLCQSLNMLTLLGALQHVPTQTGTIYHKLKKTFFRYRGAKWWNEQPKNILFEHSFVSALHNHLLYSSQIMCLIKCQVFCLVLLFFVFCVSLCGSQLYSLMEEWLCRIFEFKIIIRNQIKIKGKQLKDRDTLIEQSSCYEFL